jgi:putative transposase
MALSMDRSRADAGRVPLRPLLPVPCPHRASGRLRRWGTEIFETVFARGVSQCVEAGLVDGRKIHMDGSLLHHSDRGVQYASQAMRDRLEREGVTMSMSRKGNPWDNAMMESFFGSLKTEWIDKGYTTEAEARMEVFKYIEMFYNPTRRHSALGYVSPNEYERRYAAGVLPSLNPAAPC